LQEQIYIFIVLPQHVWNIVLKTTSKLCPDSSPPGLNLEIALNALHFNEVKNSLWVDLLPFQEDNSTHNQSV